MSLSRPAVPRSWPQFIFGLILPCATFGFAVLLDSFPFGGVSWGYAVPRMAIIALFFWCVHQPGNLPILLIFLGGLGADMIHATPLGVHAASFMIVALGAKSQGDQLRDLGLAFSWIFFAVAMFAFAVVWVLISLLATPGAFSQSLMPAILKALVLVLTTIAAYPIGHLILAALNRLFLYRRIQS